ncbi:MAG: penicillin-binding protein 2 [Gemmatimonadetes bacterium]|nr:penicillin-binding protein 2 [Gemmatimonadota bacterium]
MPRLPSRITVIAVGFGVAALAILARAAHVQLLQGGQWRQRAAAQQTVRVALPARRGTLYDRNGVALALSRETFGVGVAPREVEDVARTVSLLARAVGRPRAALAAGLRAGRVWIEWPGPYTWSTVAPLKHLRGVYLRRRLERFYPRPDLAPRIVGRLDARGRGGSGLERAFDSILAGRSGTAVMLRDSRGQTYPSPSRPAAEPVDGADVVLSLDAELQEIAEGALGAAVAGTRAAGGDVVILQPATGEVLALAGVRRAGPVGAGGSVVGDPFEPGSTAKVFTAAALLRVAKASPHDTVYAERGRYTLGGRVIEDVHGSGYLSLGDVIRLSSNIGIAKLGARLTPAEQYAALRDFGFGTPTGVDLAGEASGRLRAPRGWTRESPASLAMGYEFSVTPLQLAAAYAVFATGGLLLEPTLVREVRGGDGSVRWRHRVRPVRRVVTSSVASQLAHMLRGAVEEGTGRLAALGTYPLAGKTGTARRNIGGRYVAGHYTASFVGLFPAVDPQLVVVVKIDDPAGDYFGGATAAPVTRTILEAALATPTVTLDRSRLTRRWLPEETSAPQPQRRSEVPVVVAWPPRTGGSGGAGGLDPGEPAAPRPVPPVTGLDVREAARALHRSGFRVKVEGWGSAAATAPAAGAAPPPGSTVIVYGELGRAG